MRLKRHSAKKGRIEIIPMIDVVFFLLVFSMLSALSMAEINRLQADVPKSGGSGSGDVHRVTVNDVKGKIFLTWETPDRQGQQPLNSISQIEPVLEKAHKKDPQIAVVINIENNVPFSEGAQIVDAVKGSEAPLVIPG